MSGGDETRQGGQRHDEDGRPGGVATHVEDVRGQPHPPLAAGRDQVVVTDDGDDLVDGETQRTLGDLQDEHVARRAHIARTVGAGAQVHDRNRLTTQDEQPRHRCTRPFESFDSGYHESWDLESATHPQTLVAYALDGRFLAPAHGAPARLHSPIKLGYKNTKYLTRVVFMPRRNGGYWSDQGYEWYGGT